LRRAKEWVDIIFGDHHFVVDDQLNIDRGERKKKLKITK